MTRKFKLADNSIVFLGQGFAYGGTQYGSNWFSELTDAQKTAIGLTEIVQDPPPDGRFYFYSEDPANPGKWLIAARSIDDARAVHKQTVNAYVAAMLAQTDWMHLRAIDDATKPVPDAVLTFRNAVRTQGNALVAEINAADFDTLVSWQAHDWPELA